MRKRIMGLVTLLVLCLVMSGCGGSGSIDYSASEITSLTEVPAYSGKDYIVLNDNMPEFDEADMTDKAFEEFSPLDYLGRCGPAYANLGRELMPTEERESISHVYPSGWQSVQYDTVEGGSLFNRSHLIGFQLSGENDNERNLITGTRYMNAGLMLPYENMVADYIYETGNHVLYRVTPVYDGENLVASGVQMEGWSVEDDGEGICFNVYLFNIQPGIGIDYSNGDSWVEAQTVAPPPESDETSADYILNTNSKKFHYPDCGSVDDMSEHNKEYYSGSRADLIDKGYDPCGNCRP